MYKVFIDNRPIVFLQNNKEINKSKCFKVNSVKEIRKIIKKNDAEELKFISDKAKDLYDEFFKDYKKISASGGIVQRKGRFLVIKREGSWDLPKGKVEKKEKNKEAGIREIEEECGIKGPEIVTKLTTTLHTYKRDGKKHLKKTHWFLMTYTGSKKLKPQKEEGITDVKWINGKELSRMKKKTFGSIADVITTFEKLNK